MVDNIIKRVEYENYSIFVVPIERSCHQRARSTGEGVSPDPQGRHGAQATRKRLSPQHPRHDSSVRESNVVNFDIISCTTPRTGFTAGVPTPQLSDRRWTSSRSRFCRSDSLVQWVHWIYADEFSENHMKDVPVREKISGFVPYAGTGTGFSRKVIDYLAEEHDGHVFNESSMTRTTRCRRRSGKRSQIRVVNVLLGDDIRPGGRRSPSVRCCLELSIFR